MLNSLREVGHREPVYVTDCGLRPAQREQLAGFAEVVDAPAAAPPTTLKLRGPLNTADVDLAVVTDVDIIYRRPLYDLFDGRLVAFLNDRPERHHPAWRRLGYPIRHRQPYVNAGVLVAPPRLLPPLQRGIERMRLIASAEPGTFRTPADPFYWADQDVLNAYLSSLDPSEYAVVEGAAYWPFREDVADARLLHHIQPKPWLVPRPSTVYSREMIRLLHDGELKLPPSQLPVRLRRGAAGSVARGCLTARYHVRAHVRGRLGIRRRFRRTTTSRHFAVTT